MGSLNWKVASIKNKQLSLKLTNDKYNEFSKITDNLNISNYQLLSNIVTDYLKSQDTEKSITDKKLDQVLKMLLPISTATELLLIEFLTQIQLKMKTVIS